MATPRRGGRIVEAVLSDLSTANPLLAQDGTSREVAAALYEPLYATYPDGRPLPRLARAEPEVSPDALGYRVRLRSDARWSDGSPVTADDVKFTYDVLLDPRYSDAGAPGRAAAELHLGSVTAVDPATVEFRLRAPHAPFQVDLLTYGVLPRAAWGGLSGKEIASSPLNLAPALTSGPWKLGSGTPGSAIALARNDRHWAAPYLDQYVLRPLRDQAAVLDALTAGEADFGLLDPGQVPAAQAHRSLEVVGFPVNSFVLLGFQLDPARPGGKLFAERTVRQALLHALDRRQLVATQLLEQAVVARTCVGPYSWAYDASAGPAGDFDLAKARALLDAAGWRAGQDGVRASADGTRLSFTLLTNSDNRQRASLAKAIADAWRRAGAEVTAGLVPFSELQDRITRTREFEAFLTGFNWGVDPDQSVLWHSRSREPGGYNGMGYSNPEVDRVLDQALATPDLASRARLYSRLQQLINQDLPAPLIAYSEAVYAFNRRVHGYLGGEDGLGTFTQVAKPWLARTWVWVD